MGQNHILGHFLAFRLYIIHDDKGVAFKNRNRNFRRRRVFFSPLLRIESRNSAQILPCRVLPVRPVLVKVPFLCIVVIFIVAAVIRNGRKRPRHFTLLLAMALLPVVWSIIFVEHSIHNFATNIYADLIYALLFIACDSVCDRNPLTKHRF